MADRPGGCVVLALPAQLPCEVCGVEAVDAHHDQYGEPLSLRWLCGRHHTRLHPYSEDMFPVRNEP
ncbi:hypothetical protein GHK80_26495 [Sinorhizobium medicae]|nr:hypothetical protein [Sinorhizobium medicae]